MYPQQELDRLAVYKLALRRDIAWRRAQCAAAAGRIAKPLDWIDRVLAFARRISPLMQFAAVPLGLVLQRTLFRRRTIFGSLLRWGPLIAAAVRGFATKGGRRR